MYTAKVRIAPIPGMASDFSSRCMQPAALRRELWSMVDKESVNAATETTNHRWSAVSPFADLLKMEIQ